MIITFSITGIDVNHRDIILYGVTEKWERVIAKDSSYIPYFLVDLEEGADVDGLIYQINGLIVKSRGTENKVVRTTKISKNLLGNKKIFLKVECSNSIGLKQISRFTRDFSGVLGTLEHDVRYDYKYLFDKKITLLSSVTVTGKSLIAPEGVEYSIDIQSIKDNVGEITNYPLICFDIETYNPGGVSNVETDPVVMISYAMSNGKKGVLTWKESNQKFVKSFKTEKEMIQKFVKILQEEKPAFIIAYNSDNFDFPYLRERARKNKVKLNIGWDNSAMKFVRVGAGFSAKVKGVTHLDLYPFIRTTMSTFLKTDVFTLNAVCQELLGKGKEDYDVKNLRTAWDSGKINKPLKYSLQDSVVTLELAQKVLPLMFEMTRIVGLPIFDVCRMSYSRLVEAYLMKESRRFNEIIPRRASSIDVTERFSHTFKGGFVYEPTPGFFENIAVFDFTSLYPTIIVTHNICLTTLNAKGKDVHVSPKIEGKQFRFAKRPIGFIPTLIKGLVDRRKNVKKILKTLKKNDLDYAILNARQNAIKILANAMYGYLGFPRSRWYSNECAASITAWGRKYITDVIKRAEIAGLKVLYGDSLPYDRRIFVKNKKGNIRLVKIGEFVDKHLNTEAKNYKTLSFKNNRIVFSSISKAIRHKYDEKEKGKLLEIITKHGKTVVTPQHSVYKTNNGKLMICDAKSLRVGDKLISLTNLEIKTKYRKGYVFDLLKFDFKEYNRTIRVYKDNLVFQYKKGNCPYCNKNVILSNHVFAKHKGRRITIAEGLRKEYNWIGGDNAAHGKIPRFWTLTKELSWILGFYCAEGSVSEGKKSLLSFGNQNIQYINKLKTYFDKVLHSDLKIIKSLDKRTNKFMYYFRVQRLPIVPLFKYIFCLGKGSENKKVPWFIFNSENEIKEEFINGYLAGDGNKKKDKRYKTKFIQFSTKSKELAIGIHFLLKTLKHGKNYFGKTIEHISWKYRKDKPKVSNLRLQSVKSVNQGKNYCLTEIKSIKKIGLKSSYVYDLEVKGVHNFIDAEGLILVHNTDSCFFLLPSPSINEAKKFVKSVNANLPGIMELKFEGFFKTGLFVSKKSNKKGAKKKYALCDDNNELMIKGFEFVRRDWSVIAKELQLKTLKLILTKKDFKAALKLLQDTVKKVRTGKIPLEQFVIKTRMTKSIKSYTSVGPHVRAAMRASKNEEIMVGSMIHFVVTKGKGRIGDRAYTLNSAREKNLTPDYDYYINNQILPSVKPILYAIGFKPEEVELKEQKTLAKFI